jgi:hypothetical protein
MSDLALKDPAPTPPAWLRTKPQEGASRQPENLLALSVSQALREVDPRPSQPQQRDWSSALELIREASEAVRFSEERVTELESEMQELAAKAAEGLRSLESQLSASERRNAQFEERARLAEARASEAEGWLVRLHDAIVASFAKETDSSADMVGTP